MQNCNITEKQISYIEGLSKNPLEIASRIFKREIVEYGELSKGEIVSLINHLKSRMPLTNDKLEFIKSKYTWKEIQDRFGNKVDEEWKLNQYHYDILFGDKFKSVYVDHPIKNTMDWEYGWQESPVCENGKMFYIKFYDFMMIDYDKISLEDVLEKLKPHAENCLFHIYKTHNGYHAYLTSHLINHRFAREFMEIAGCDFFYIKFAIVNGYKIRLSRKINRDEKEIETYVQTYGNGEMLEECEKFLQVIKSYF